MLSFLISIAGAAALLIWAVRLVRTGVERAFSPELRVMLRRSSQSRILASGAGLLSAMFLQSSTAVALLVSNFAAKGTLSVAVGLAIILGADVGSALVAKLLLLRQPLLVPALLLLGTALFLRSRNRKPRQAGRILIGLALIFVSLDMLRGATAPLLNNEGAASLLGYLQTDLLAAFVIGAVFAWVVHSSVAAVLFFVTMVAQGALPVPAALAMVLGANLGGSLIAYVLTLAASHEARRIVVANLLLRGGGAALLLVLLNALVDYRVWLGADGAQQVIHLHILFNLALCALALPFARPVARVTDRLVVRQIPDISAQIPTALDPGALEDATRALSCAARETMRMGERIEAMLIAVDGLFDHWDDAIAATIKANDESVRKIHLDIKLYLAALNRKELDETSVKGAMDLSLLATNLEAASDMIARSLLGLARRLNAEGIKFSDAGRQEIGEFHDRVLANVQLGLNVMMTGNPDEARELVAQKEAIRGAEQALQRKHLGRLREGLAESIETSNIHQETLRALKQVNASFAMAGYPILVESGDLLSSRLTG